MRSGKLLLIIVLAFGFGAVALAQTAENSPTLSAVVKKAMTAAENEWLRHIKTKSPEMILNRGLIAADEMAVDAEAWKEYTAELRGIIAINRDWYDFWSRRKELSENLLAAYEQALAEIEAGPEKETLTGRLELLREYTAICAERLTLLDRFLKLVEATIDAYELRLAADETLAQTVFESKAAHRRQLHRFNGEFTGALTEVNQALSAVIEAEIALAKKQADAVQPQVDAAESEAAWKTAGETMLVESRTVLSELPQALDAQKAVVAALAEKKARYDDHLRVGDLEQDLRAVEETWYGHLTQNKPQIFHFAPPDENKVKTREERWTYHIFELGEKARNNRAWYDYWKEQLNLTTNLSNKYRQAIDKVGDSEHTAAAKARMQSHLAALQEWMALCEKKMSNQDVYLKAIEMEKEAFENRLDAARKESATPDLPDAKSVKTSANNSMDSWLPSQNIKPTAYTKYKAALANLQNNLTDQQNRLSETENEQAFALKLVEAANILLESFRADNDLAAEELAIAEKQSVGRDELDDVWLKRWDEIKVMTTAKVADLKTGAAEQEDTVRLLESEASYLGERIKIITNRITDLQERVAAHKTGIYKALALTVRDIAFTRGLIIVAYLLAGWLAIRLIRKIGKVIVKRAADRGGTTNSEAEKTAGTLVGVFSSMGRAVVYLVLVLLILSTMGVNVGPLMGAFAIFGLAISFGSQNLVKDVVNGFFMLLENQVSVGDVVEAGGVAGQVEKVTLRRLVLRDIQGTTHNVPHGQITTLSNKTQAWSRAVVEVGVAYQCDLRQVFRVFNEVGQKIFEENEWRPLLMEAPNVVGVMGLGDRAIPIRVWAQVAPAQQWAVERELYLRLKEACDANGIEIPFPQRVVELKGVPVQPADDGK